jgi:hypothetical protein
MFQKSGPRRATKLLLGAYTAALGLGLGGGVFEAVVVIPRWARTRSPDMLGAALDESGHVRAGGLYWPYAGGAVAALAVASLPVAVCSPGRHRAWWVGSSGTVTGLSVVTAAFFVPQIKLFIEHAERYPETELRSRVVRWVQLDRVRLVTGALAWAAALRAMATVPS